MKASTTIPALLAVLAAFQAAPAEGVKQPPPLTFARSGREAEIVVTFDHDREFPKEVVLFVFGREWTEPVSVKNGTATVAVPKVRVPTVFFVVSADAARQVVGRLVAYPDRNVKWNPKLKLYAAAAPKWFRQWAAAVGLPLTFVEIDDLTGEHVFPDPEDTSENRLLVLGAASAGKSVRDVLTVSRKQETNVLVLDAEWFKTTETKVESIAPAGMNGPLAEVAGHAWAAPLTFARDRNPHGDILNRWAWIRGEQFPVVEEVGFVSSTARVVLSYVPWQEVLGREETAEVTFTAVLEAGAAAVPGRQRRMPDVIWPPPQVVEKTAKERPVLAAAVKVWQRRGLTDIPARVYVLDLRGEQSPPPTFTRTLDVFERRTGPPRLIVLGDDALLDGWKWFKLDRKKMHAKCPGVVWLPDDTLPPQTDAQIRLMLALSEFNVPLDKAGKEKTDED